MSEEQLGLYGKIAAVQAAMKTLEKKGDVDYNTKKGRVKFDYFQEEDLMLLLKPELSKHGLALLPSTKGWRRISDSRVEVTFELTVADDAGKWTGTWVMEAEAYDDKGYNRAYTSVMRYALQKTFQIPVAKLEAAEYSDVAGAQDRQPAVVQQPPPPTPAAGAAQPRPEDVQAAPATGDQKSGLLKLAVDGGVTPDALANMILVVAGAEPREFDSPEEGARLRDRLIDRLPAKLVEPLTRMVVAGSQAPQEDA